MVKDNKIYPHARPIKDMTWGGLFELFSITDDDTLSHQSYSNR